MVENWKSNLLRVALMYGAMAVIMLWSGYLSYRAVGQDTDSTWEFNLVIFMWGLCVFGCLSASFTMERMKSKTGRQEGIYFAETLDDIRAILKI